MRSRVVIITGYAGSGKTTVGRLLAQETGSVLLDKDATTQPLVEYALETQGLPAEDRESHQYVEKIRPLEYQSLVNIIADNMAMGSSMVVVAPWAFSYDVDGFWDEFREQAFDHGCDLLVVWVACDPTSMRSRLIDRGEPRDSHKLDHWVDYSRGLSLFTGVGQSDYVIDNRHDERWMVEQVDALVDILDS